MMLDFIKNFYISSHINVAMRSTTAHSKKKASAEIIAKWDLDLFWNSIQDENQSLEKQKDVALNCLIDLIERCDLVDE